MLERGTSPVDWCEPNYEHSTYIAEFSNTLSNVPIILLPLLGIRLNNSYFTYVTHGAKWIYYAFLLVGLFSAYYHATLSLVGQLLDELGILWVITVSFAVWLPGMRYVPKVLKQHPQQTSFALVLVTLVVSGLSFLKPSINAYLLMTLSVPVLVRLIAELKLTNDDTASDLCLYSGALWSAAVSIWMSDRTMCNYWQNVGFPYFHAIWHIVSAVACYYVVVLCSYLDALAQAPQLNPVVRYYRRYFVICLPYVTLKGPNKSSAFKSMMPF